MNYLDEIKFNYFPNNIETKRPLGEITLRQLIERIKNPKESTVKLFKGIKKASSEGNMKLKAELKSKLFYFTPCVKLNGRGRKYSDIVGFNGVVQIDFDGILNAKKFRDYLFDTFKSIIFAGVSASGRGVKVLIRIPEANSVEEFKEYFCGLAFYLERFRGFDVAPYNCVLPLYLFCDKDLKYRENPTISKVKGYKINEFKKFEGNISDLGQIDNLKEEDCEYIKNIFKRGIGNIVSNGHPQVVKYSTVLGGYVVSGYIDEDSAFDLIEEEIYKNDYLSKNPRGYIRTAKEMMIRGTSSPLFLEKHKNNNLNK